MPANQHRIENNGWIVLDPAQFEKQIRLGLGVSICLTYVLEWNRQIPASRRTKIGRHQFGNGTPILVRSVAHKELIERTESAGNAGGQADQPEEQLLVASELADGWQQVVEVERFLRR